MEPTIMHSSGPLAVERMDISSPTSSKRKREESRYEVDLGARSHEAAVNHSNANANDCFQEAFSGHLLTSSGDVRSSWLTNEHCWTHESVLHAAKRHYGVVSLKEQLKATQQQLLELKRHFQPAAEQCATTYNNIAQGISPTSPSLEFQEARSMCNPFEELHLDGMFLNRAGIKLANIDALVDFRLTTNYSNASGEFVFVDLCGAPGGFSEYLLKKFHANNNNNIHSCRGYGMSLLGTNEHGHGATWKLQHVLDAAATNTIQTPTHVQYEIVHGRDGTGDVYQWQNVEALKSHVQNKANLVVADGGFDAQRNAECQEEIAGKIVVCQASAALTLLQSGGTFVLKMFGFQCDTTRRMMMSMFGMFEKVTVVKPISSRPASAERYAVFEGFKGVPLDFDGFKWQTAILLGGASNGSNVGIDHSSSELETNLMDCLDECDRDILQLNQKACFEILSYMERKTAAAQSNNTTGSPWGAATVEKTPIPTHAYKHEWRLD